jgi:hypothetical protein
MKNTYKRRALKKEKQTTPRFNMDFWTMVRIQMTSWHSKDRKRRERKRKERKRREKR